MFGISIQKLLVLAIVIGGLIVAFRLISVLKRQQEISRRERQTRRTTQSGRTQEAPRPGQAQIQDMAACGRCGAYIASEAGGCGRKDCPFKSA